MIADIVENRKKLLRLALTAVLVWAMASGTLQAQEKAPVDEPEVAAGEDDEEKEEKEKGSWTTWQNDDFSVELFGQFAAETILTSDVTSPRSYILYAQPRAPVRQPQATITGQSTVVGVRVSAPKVGSFQTGGLVSFDFHGSKPAANEAGVYFMLGYAELFNEDWRFRFGMQLDSLAPVAPLMVDWGVAQAAGNLGSAYRGQFRVERFFHPSETTRWALMGVVSQQAVTDLNPNPEAVGVDNGLPNFEGRLGVELGPEDGDSRPISIGVSGVYGEVATAGEPFVEKVVSSTWAVALDARWDTERFGLRGELFTGQALGTYMGGIGQSLNLQTGAPIRTAGGFGQILFRPVPEVLVSFIYGMEDPEDADLAAKQRSRNRLAGGNIFWNLADHLELAIEYGHWQTDYMAPSQDNQVNVVNFRVRVIF